MNIGKKIKEIRTNKLMTQSDIAGTQISRNMLSLIENGKADPSLTTVLYVAQRLNVPAGLLLCDEEEELVYKKMDAVPNIKRAYAAGEWRMCEELCRDFYEGSPRRDDDELNLILAECHVGLAKENLWLGRLHAVASHLDQALEFASQTIYRTEHISAVTSIYFRYIGSIASSLYSDVELPSGGERIAAGDEFCRYVLALEAAAIGHFSFVKDYLEGEESGALKSHVMANMLFKQSEFSDAYTVLIGILKDSPAIPQTVLYKVFEDLEDCCKELNDYKGAYEYAHDKVALFERLLSGV